VQTAAVLNQPVVIRLKKINDQELHLVKSPSAGSMGFHEGSVVSCARSSFAFTLITGDPLLKNIDQGLATPLSF